MPGIDEALGQQTTPMAADNQAGLDAISYFQTVEFTRYRRFVLPADGFVFWIRADIAGESSIYDESVLNSVDISQGPSVVAQAPTITVKGSVHYATDTRQEQEEVYAVNRVIFTAQSEVEDLNRIAPDTLWIGEIDGIRFAFTARNSFYRQAGLWHYVGDAVYADMETQIVDDPAAFNTLQVVSNSLPIWLSMNDYPVEVWNEFNNTLKLYPSFLSPDSLRPPFATVHIPPESTTALAGAATLGRTLSHEQLTTERVEITFWGVRNDGIMNFTDFINQFSLDTDLIGIQNMPIVRDDKRTQSELGTIAMKKTVTYQVSYYQSSARNTARQLIKKAVPTFIFN